MNPSLFLGSSDRNSRNTPPATNFVKPILSRVLGSTPTRFRQPCVSQSLTRELQSGALRFARWSTSRTSLIAILLPRLGSGFVGSAPGCNEKETRDIDHLALLFSANCTG
jgi:hypothetical protein